MALTELMLEDGSDIESIECNMELNVPFFDIDCRSLVFLLFLQENIPWQSNLVIRLVSVSATCSANWLVSAIDALFGDRLGNACAFPSWIEINE